MAALPDERDNDVGQLPAASGRGGSHVEVASKTVRFNAKVIKHKIYESGHDHFTFDNLNSDGTPRVSQTQCRRNTELPNIRKHVPADTIWAHHRAVSLALEGALVGLPAARGITFVGRRPRYTNPYVDDLNLDDEYCVDEDPNTVNYINTSYRPMAFWDGRNVYYKKFDMKSRRWVVRMTDVSVALRWIKKRWNRFCHVGDVPSAATPGVNARGEAANMARRKVVVEWIVDSGAGVHLINTSKRRESRFQVRPCQPFEVQGVGGYKTCDKEAVIEFDAMNICIEAGITDSPYNLLSVELLRQKGVSFISSGHPYLPPFLLLPNGMHAIVLEVQGEVPIWRQNDAAFLPEPVVLHDGLRVPASFAAKFALAGVTIEESTCSAAGQEATEGRPSLTTDDNSRDRHDDVADTTGTSAEGGSTDAVAHPPGTSAGQAGCHVPDDPVGGGPIRLALIP